MTPGGLMLFRFGKMVWIFFYTIVISSIYDQKWFQQRQEGLDLDIHSGGTYLVTSLQGRLAQTRWPPPEFVRLLIYKKNQLMNRCFATDWAPALPAVSIKAILCRNWSFVQHICCKKQIPGFPDSIIRCKNGRANKLAAVSGNKWSYLSRYQTVVSEQQTTWEAKLN